MVADGANEVQLRGISHAGLLAGFFFFLCLMESQIQTVPLALTSSLTNLSSGQKEVWGSVYKSIRAKACPQ